MLRRQLTVDLHRRQLTSVVSLTTGRVRYENPHNRGGSCGGAGGAGAGIVGACREAVRAGGAVPAWPGGGRTSRGAAADCPVRGCAAPGVAADSDDADP